MKKTQTIWNTQVHLDDFSILRKLKKKDKSPKSINLAIIGSDFLDQKSHVVDDFEQGFFILIPHRLTLRSPLLLFRTFFDFHRFSSTLLYAFQYFPQTAILKHHILLNSFLDQFLVIVELRLQELSSPQLIVARDDGPARTISTVG